MGWRWGGNELVEDQSAENQLTGPHKGRCVFMYLCVCVCVCVKELVLILASNRRIEPLLPGWGGIFHQAESCNHKPQK